MGEGTHTYGDRAPHNLQYVVLVASSNLTQERVLTGTANQITLTDNGAGSTVVLSVPADFIVPTTITIPNTGLHILDTNASHDLIIAPGSDLTADRTLTLTTGDAARTITLSGNPTLADWFDQAVKAASTPTFGGIIVADSGTIGQAAGPLMNFDDTNNYLEITGCNVGIGTATPDASGKLHVSYGATISNGIANPGIILESNAAVALNIVTPNDAVGYINFGDPEDSNIGRILYAHATDHMRFDVAAGEAMRIDSAQQVGIGVTVMGARFQVGRAANINAVWVTDAGGAQRIRLVMGILNNAGHLFAYKDGTSAGGRDFILNEYGGNVGINVVPTGKLHVDQSSTTAAIPVLVLDQADISEGFINHIGTSAASAAGPISTWTAGNSIQGFVRTEINGAQFWQPYYSAPTS